MPDTIGRRLGANPYLLLAIASLCWSGNHVVGRAAVGHVPPIALATLRWLLPALILWRLAQPHLGRDWPIMRAQWRIVLLLSLTGGALFGVLQYVGLNYTTAVNTSVLNSTAPVLIVVAGALIFRDALTLPQVAGIATSLVGVLVIVTRADLSVLLSMQFNWGDLIIFGNQFVWAVYAACLRIRPQVHWLSFLFGMTVIAGLATLPLLALEIAAGQMIQPTSASLLVIGYVALFPSIVAYATWHRGIDLIGPNRAGAFLHLIPLYSAILGTLLLGEELFPFHVIGFVLILTGVWTASRQW